MRQMKKRHHATLCVSASAVELAQALWHSRPGQLIFSAVSTVHSFGAVAHLPQGTIAAPCVCVCKFCAPALELEPATTAQETSASTRGRNLYFC